MKLINKFIEEGIVRNGHFQLRSGKHSDKYVLKDLIYTKPELLRNVYDHLITILPPRYEYDIIAVAAESGIAIGSYISYISGKPLVWISKKSGSKEVFLRDAFTDVVRDKRILIVEDIITTGGTVKNIIDIVGQFGAKETVGIRAIWNRGDWKEDPRLRLGIKSIIEYKFDAWEKEDCPLCSHGQEFQDPKEKI